MGHVVSQPPPPFLAAGGKLRVHLVPAAHDNLIWLFGPPGSAEVYAVDGPGASELDAYCAREGLSLRGILNTHVHHDHIGLNKELASQGRLQDLEVLGAADTAAEIPGLTQALTDAQGISLFGVEGLAMSAEGHLRGHMCYRIGDLLFSGDALFSGGCGRMFSGPPAAMYHTLCKLAALPGETTLLCGHEYTQDNLRFALWLLPKDRALAARVHQLWPRAARGECVAISDISTERATNPFLRCNEDGPLLTAVERCVGHKLSPGIELFTALRALKDSGPHRAVSDATLLPQLGR